MIFEIKKNSQLPWLKMELILDGRNDYKNFYEDIQNANITFSMIDVEDGCFRLSNKPAYIVPKDSNCACDCVCSFPDEYYVVYKWQVNDTVKSGTYKGEFKINFLSGYTSMPGTLIAPIKEDLFIYILDSSIK